MQTTVASIQTKPTLSINHKQNMNRLRDDTFIIEITPEKAKEILDSSPTKNRKLKVPNIERYAEDMREGRWKLTHEIIQITPYKELIQGRHRLLAVIKAGVPVKFRITYNAEGENFAVLDTGSKRSAADVFEIAGAKYSTLNPAIIQGYYLLKNDKRGKVQANSKLTHAELLQSYTDNTEYWDGVCAKATIWNRQIVNLLHASVIGAFYAHLSLLSERDATRFFDQLCTGLNIESTSIATLKNFLIRDSESKKNTTNLIFRQAYIIKAWNGFRTKKELKHMKYNPELETFPKAI